MNWLVASWERRQVKSGSQYERWTKTHVVSLVVVFNQIISFGRLGWLA